MSRSADSQAILSPITEAAIFLTVVLEEGKEGGIPDVLSEITGLKRSVGFRLPVTRNWASRWYASPRES